MADKLKKLSKAHIRYKDSNGKIVPGATTITGLLNKPALVKWANKLGLEGNDVDTYVDSAAIVGTMAHAMVQAHLQNTPFDAKEFPAENSDLVDLAENAFLSYLEWEKGHTVDVIMCETPLVSDTMRFGGTMDCYCKLDGKFTLLDFKTGKGIYDEYFYQVSAYRYLLEEAGYPVDQIVILNIPRTEDENFAFKIMTNTVKSFEIFKHLLSIYWLKKEK